MKEAYLGIDTSNYRTSVCMVGPGGEILFEARELLPVPAGERGLRQSEALFIHLKFLPELMSRVTEKYTYLAVGASTRPRPFIDSYMPVFRAGEALGRFLSSLLQIPFYEFSHQEGHLAAGEYSLPVPLPVHRFLAVHLSGGTSELLRVERGSSGYTIEKMGGTLDLHAGQLIDRIGVEMGLPFPSGPFLEEMAGKAKGEVRLPSYTKGYSFSFSGAESALLRLVAEGKLPREEIAFAALQVVANSLEKVLRQAVEETGLREILIVGGVAANRIIRERLKKRLEHRAVGARLYFADPRFAGDNAYGIARLTRSLHQQTKSLN
ncbi:O-sialoglycoprotein endopeptidase [Thermicanus aegyptius]|uniref:Kae1-like domain-containing protein n=1 Tax=Thermicanus aegyptius TaxID=94009 RepID=UPI00041D8C9E|nr:O-sialoglycoprotein endopeptidase [Thermicanus aegyptius]